MSAFGYLFIKEYKQFTANPFMPVVLVILPLLLMLLVPLAANMEVRDVRLAVVDRDRSTMSVQLIDRISQSGYFVFSSYEDSYESAAEVLSRGRADIILEIPSGMEKAVGRGETAEIYIAANAVNNTKGAMGGGYLSSIVTDFSSELSATGSAPPMKIVPQYRYNPGQEYKLFMVPALMIVVIILVGGFFPTLSIVSEKENGTIEQINVSPVRKRDFILSKVVFYGILGVFAFTLSILTAHFVYGLASRGGLLEIYVSAMIFLVLLIFGRIKNDNRMLLIVRTARINDQKVEALIFSYYDKKAILRVKNTTEDSVEFIYELSRKVMNRSRSDKTITEAVYEIGNIEYFNIVAQNDEISS